MKRRRLAVLGMAAAMLAGSAFAQDFWVKKKWQDWNPNETKKMLEDSPWARKWVYTEVEEGRQQEGYSGSGRESRRELYYTVQLRSAAPLRQAVARDVQIQNKYDKMTPEQKAALDERTNRFIDGAGGDTIVVHVIFKSTLQQFERAVHQYWKDFPEGTVPVGANLTTSSGKRVGAIRMIAPPGGAFEFELIFPRTADGEPLITDKDKSIRVEFPSGLANERVFVEFKLDKMAWNGQLAY